MLPVRLAFCTVEGQPPTMSCYKDFDPALVVFNSRFQSQLADFRRLLSPAWKEPDRPAMAARTFLKAVAELALRPGNGDAATAAFLRAMSITPPLPDMSQDLAETFRPISSAVVDTPHVVCASTALPMKRATSSRPVGGATNI